MFEKIFKPGARAAGHASLLAVFFLTISSISVPAQNSRPDVNEKSGVVEFTPRAGQITKQVIELPAERAISVVNHNATPVNVDLVAFDLEGKEAGRETIRVDAGKSTGFLLGTVFSNLALDKLSDVEIQASVLSPRWDPSSFTSTQETNALQLPVGFFSQHQSPWYSYQLGTCPSDTIGSSGCAITSIAMAMTSSVTNLDPGVLNTYLKNNGGYASGCLVIWDSADEIDGPGGFQYYGSGTVGSAANMKSLIDSGKFSVVKSTRFLSHFVVVIGYANSGTALSDFYYLDPQDISATFHYIGDGYVSSSSVTHIYK
jgi:hypothetical protein